MNDMEFQRTVALNNHGVAMLAAGNASSALSLFRAALQTTMGLVDQFHPNAAVVPHPSVQAIYAEPNQETLREAEEVHRPAVAVQHHVIAVENSTPQDPQALARASTFSQIQGQQPSSHWHLLDEDSVIGGENGELQNVFCRGINLIPSRTAYHPDHLVNMFCVSAIILFNLAVVYHLHGIRSSTRCAGKAQRERSRMQAQSLYFKAQALLTDAGFSMSSSYGNAVMDVIIMAIHNNLGQCKYSEMDYPTSLAHLSRLVAYAATVQPFRHERYDLETANLLDWHKSFFLLNTIALQPPHTASAA